MLHEVTMRGLERPTSATQGGMETAGRTFFLQRGLCLPAAPWRRTDSGWTGAVFGEMTGERGGGSHRISRGQRRSASTSTSPFPPECSSPFIGRRRPFYPRERVRFALNFAYFF